MRTRLALTTLLIAIFTVLAQTPAHGHANHGPLPMACDFGPDQRGISCHELNRAVAEAADEFSLDHARFRRMVACESHYDPEAVNGPYGGMTQQGGEFWNRWAPRFNYVVDVDLGAGRPYASRFHPWDNTRLAAFVIRWYENQGSDGYTEWGCKG